MQVKILGPLAISSDGHTYTPSSIKMRQVLALLLSSANTVVSTEAFTEELWGESPPRSVKTTLQTYIYKLRKELAEAFPEAGLDNALVTRSPGYMFTVPAELIDANDFERLSREGRRLLSAQRPDKALVRLNSAIGLWSGSAMENVPKSRRLMSHAIRLDELRTEALQLQIVTQLRMGVCHKLIPELRELAERHPLNEWFHGQLMFVLARAGRRNEALEVYHRLRKVLNDELGLGPSAEVRKFHLEIIQDQEGSAPFPVY